MGAGVEVRHEALWEGRVSASDVFGHKGIVEPLGRRRYVDTEGQYDLVHRCTMHLRQEGALRSAPDDYHGRPPHRRAW